MVPNPRVLRKSPARVAPNLADYPAEREGFSWARASAALAGLPGGNGINIAYEAVDRHVAEGRGERTALRHVPADGPATSVTYAELAAQSNRFANVLRSLGV